MDVGKPCSQSRGTFHGREETLSGSSEAQPAANNARKAAAHRAKTNFDPSGEIFILVENLVAFDEISILPLRKDVGEAAVRFNRGNLYFAHQFSITVHQHLAAG